MIKFIFLLIIFLISIISFPFIVTQPLLFLILIPLIGVFIILFIDFSMVNKIGVNTSTITATPPVPVQDVFEKSNSNHYSQGQGVANQNIKETVSPFVTHKLKLLINSLIKGFYLLRSSTNTATLQDNNQNTQNVNSILFIIALFFSLINFIISMIM